MGQNMYFDQLSGRSNGYLPRPVTPILGREKEVKNLIDLLDKHQLVTITGTGGIGKTRISFEICHHLNPEFPEGIIFLSMATLTDAKEVIPTLANALGITESESRKLAEGVTDILSNKKMLIVLDNLEHVISAAKEISNLVALCPKVKILCTSRTPLKIIAEQEFSLHTLLLPSQVEFDLLLDYPAIELFVRSAQKVNKDFELTPENANTVTEICCSLDGLPLAIELAAARLKVLSPKQLLQRLNNALNVLTSGSKDLPERHQTLRATINWSFNLLTANESQLFRRLSVFAKGFTLEAIEEVCYEKEKDSIRALDEIESLLNKGLVEKIDDQSRFTLLQTIKDFAMEKLEFAGEVDPIFQRHALHFYDFSKMLSEGTRGEQQNERMNQGALEESNIQVALDFLLEKAKNGDEDSREIGLNICGELWLYWHITGKHKSAKVYINAFFEATENPSPSIGSCKALFCLHVASFTLKEVEQSKEAASRLYNMANVLNDELEIAKGSFALGFGNMLTNLELANKYGDETYSRFKKLKDNHWIGLLLWQKGVFNLLGNDLKKAKECYSKALEIFQKTTENEGKECALSGLSMIEFITGNYDKAIELYQAALLAFKTVGDRPEQARLLSEISWTYLAVQDTNAALKYTLESIQAHKEVGSTRGIGLSMYGLAAIEAVEGRPKNALEIAAAAMQFAEQKGVAIELGVNNQGKIYLDNAKKGMSALEIEQAENAGKNYLLNDVLQLVEKGGPLKYPDQMSKEDPFIKKLKEVIEANLIDSEFGVNQLYNAISMSQMQVYRKLNALTNQTPSQLIRQYRLQKGKELLNSTEKTISEIAYQVGFTDPNYFSRSFQKEYKQSPRAYRK